MTTFRILPILASGLFIMLWSSLAVAQQQDDDSLVVLLTEKTEVRGEAPTSDYWWSSPSSPSWTETDNALRERLHAEGIGVQEPSSDSRISKIYRRPGLSFANASTLAELIGGEHFVVGDVTYRQNADVGPLGAAHVEATAEVSIARTGAPSLQSGKTLTLTRNGYGTSANDALSKSRSELASALGQILVVNLEKGPGRVGWSSGERLIGLRRAASGSSLEGVRDFLESLDGISRVEVRWASQGVIALEVNPGKEDPADTLEYAVRALSNQTFEDFVLARQPNPVSDELAEFLVSEATEIEDSRRGSDVDR